MCISVQQSWLAIWKVAAGLHEHHTLGISISTQRFGRCICPINFICGCRHAKREAGGAADWLKPKLSHCPKIFSSTSACAFAGLLVVLRTRALQCLLHMPHVLDDCITFRSTQAGIWLLVEPSLALGLRQSVGRGWQAQVQVLAYGDVISARRIFSGITHGSQEASQQLSNGF